jgi:hypothetical protein
MDIQMDKNKTFVENHPHLKEFFAFLDILNKKSERGAMLVAATMIDDLLERCIKSFLVEDEEIDRLLVGFNAPLGTLSARTLAALALGILSKDEYKECERLRKIRNVFAHNIHSSFEEQRLIDLCADLEMSAKDNDNVIVGGRGKYTTSAISIILNLTNRPHYATKRRLKFNGWSY